MKINRIDHVGINVLDLTAAREMARPSYERWLKSLVK